MRMQQQTGTMTVRIRARAAEAPWGSGLTNPVVRTVTISDRCPVCGGPRGEARNMNQCDDGAHYSVDVWDNSCGHVDSYEAVYREAQRLAAPQPDEALRLARIIQAGAAALGAYEKYVKALADNATVDATREAYEAFRIADGAVIGLRARRGYEHGDHVRLRNSLAGPWRGVTGVLAQGMHEPEYRFRLVFDEPQPSEHQPDGLARSCLTDIDSITDIEP